MQDTIELLNLQIGFEGWADNEGFDLAISKSESRYIDPQTLNAWRGYLAVNSQHSKRHAGQQLYAEIKKSSKYASQAELCRNSQYGYPFKVCIVEDFSGYVVKGGIGGQYRVADVNLYVMHDGKKIRLH